MTNDPGQPSGVTEATSLVCPAVHSFAGVATPLSGAVPDGGGVTPGLIHQLFGLQIKSGVSHPRPTPQQASPGRPQWSFQSSVLNTKKRLLPVAGLRQLSLSSVENDPNAFGLTP